MFLIDKYRFQDFRHRGGWMGTVRKFVISTVSIPKPQFLTSVSSAGNCYTLVPITQGSAP